MAYGVQTTACYRVSRECKLDFEWWNELLMHWNGKCFFELPQWQRFQMQTRQGSLAMEFFIIINCLTALNWSTQQAPLGIVYKELFPIDECRSYE